MTDAAKLLVDGKSYELPVLTGTEGDRALDITRLRNESGMIALDEFYRNTGSCSSKITFIDGEKGILRYRGYPIEQLAEHSSFIEVAWLLIFGELPTQQEREVFADLLTQNATLHESMRKHFDAFPPNGHPMAIMSSMINAMSMHERPRVSDDETLLLAAARLISKVRTIAAAAHKASIGEPLVYPRKDLKYVENFLHMMFTEPYEGYYASPEAARALNMFFVLHADHEQNCSTSTVRTVASGQANMYASAAAGVCALWGPLHGGANTQTVKMLLRMHEEGMSVSEYVARAKDRTSDDLLMGFGHAVYRNFDPRARVLKRAADDLLESMHITDPLLDLAKELEEAALADDYFVERKLYPNVDFYSGIILRALGIPLDMFTVMFAIGRMPGWIAHWKEVQENPKARIYRPRQLYVGPAERDWVPREQR